MNRILAALCVFILTQVQEKARTPAATDIQEGARIWEGYFTFQNDCKLCHSRGSTKRLVAVGPAIDQPCPGNRSEESTDPDGAKFQV